MLSQLSHKSLSTQDDLTSFSLPYSYIALSSNLENKTVSHPEMPLEDPPVVYARLVSHA